MNTHRKTAIIVGVLFIVGTVSGVLSVGFLGDLLEGVDYASIAANEVQIIIPALLILVMGFALAMVPVMLYPIFKEYNGALALGSVVFRGALETVIYIAQAIILLLLLTMSQEYAAAAASDTASLQTLGTFLLQVDHWLAIMLSLVFGLGALMIYCVFYQSKLIPRCLSAWGLVGAVLYLAAPLLGMFGFELDILMLPLALQEMALAVWLIAKGFNPSAIASEAA